MGSFSFPFVGSKRDRIQGVQGKQDDSVPWLPYLPAKASAIYEPFAGSGAFSFECIDHYSAHSIKIYFAETDPGMRSIWASWGKKSLQKKIDMWKDLLLLAHLRALLQFLPVAAFCRSGKGSSLITGRRFAVTARDGQPTGKYRWRGGYLDLLKSHLRIVRDALVDEISSAKGVRLAAAYAVLKRFSHGSIMRSNNSDHLNVSLSIDKCKPSTISSWVLTYPQDHKPRLKIFKSAQSLIYSKADEAIALIDPPYYVDRDEFRCMTACYPGHRPHDRATLDLCTDATRKALRAGVGTVIVTNYWCRELGDRLDRLAREYGYQIDSHTHGVLAKMGNPAGNASSGKRTISNKKAEPFEVVWIFRPKLHQLKLWD